MGMWRRVKLTVAVLVLAWSPLSVGAEPITATYAVQVVQRSVTQSPPYVEPFSPEVTEPFQQQFTLSMANSEFVL